MNAHCLFEQSGTFKNAFKKNGIRAFDYDIRNDFGETDNLVDLFAEIRGGYNGEPSIFDDFQKDDLILAFFPCTRFEARVPLLARGDSYQHRKATDEQKLEYSRKIVGELNEMYQLLCMMILVCARKGLQLVIENPYTQPHFLTQYFPLKPKIIDKDRTENGDWYKKPTQYFFINCEPKNKLLFEPIEWVEPKAIATVKGTETHSRQVERSMIHPQYADRFIRQELI